MSSSNSNSMTVSEIPFLYRHIGPDAAEQSEMLKTIGQPSLAKLIDLTVPTNIRLKGDLQLEAPLSEQGVLAELQEIAAKNQLKRSLIGMGYYGTLTPGVIQRNILENPGWYTQYTPYQAEISQGRLEALLNYQTMVSELTALPISNASLLDEATAAAEALAMCYRLNGSEQKNCFVAASDCHPQTLDLLKTRAEPLGIKLEIHPRESLRVSSDVFGVLLQNPTTEGLVWNVQPLIEQAQQNGALVCVASDLLAMTLIKPAGECGADMVLGSAQRFGVPLGFGGPHAAFLACKDQHKRQLPGRLIGVSKDANGDPAMRLALQTREQHIRREKATSNICTAQVLLAVMASMYAVYHGPRGLKQIAQNVHDKTAELASTLVAHSYKLKHSNYFDTLTISLTNKESDALYQAAQNAGFNLRRYEDGALGISLDESLTKAELDRLIQVFVPANSANLKKGTLLKPALFGFERSTQFLSQPVFNSHHSETEMLRYIRRLESRDLSLTSSMIPLGSCTMKLNATTEMFPVSWSSFSNLHPFAPLDQSKGYQQLFSSLEGMLKEIMGFDAVSLQPNAGSQGEYAGLLAIRAYQRSKGEKHRNICLIPSSAHGTNPATASMVGLDVVTVGCLESGDIDINDLKIKLKQHSKNLSCLMVTYPSTHGVFESGIKEIAELVHQHSGQVYMDGANLNAQVGLCRPGDIGADVCHTNLHKTFCIPHGGGGPGMGPIGVKKHLAPFLPGHAVAQIEGLNKVGAVSAAPYGSASILVIPWVYIRLMGAVGLRHASEVAILNANYISKRLEPYFPTLYIGSNKTVAHECIVDCRQFKATAHVEVEDIAKRLMDYGFHAPTVSFPVPGTLMIEPTESESKGELDRFCDAMISIYHEIKEIESGKLPAQDNPLKNAPHTASMLMSDDWTHPYSRERAAFPVSSLRTSKFWPSVRRVDGVYGDRNLVCSCIA